MITRKTIHKIFEPLQITVSTVVGGEAAQIYDALNKAWTPDRTVAGQELTIQPHVLANTSAADTSWQNGDYIKQVRELNWYANGTPIEQVETLRGKYVIDRSGGDTNGRITFKKNLDPGEHYDLTFVGYFADTRNNTPVKVQTDPVPVMVSEVAPAEWDLSVVHDTSIKYKPLSDKLKEYDWKVANGKITPSDAERKKCLDGNQYLLSLPIIISYGSGIIDSTSKLWSKVSLKFFVVRGGTEIPADDALFVREFDKTKLTLDQRLIPDGTVLRLVLYYDGVEYGSEYMTFSLVIDKYSCEPSNEGDYTGGSEQFRVDVAKCVNLSAGRPMLYPEAYLHIEWYTDSQNAKDVYQGEGERVSMPYSDINIGDDQEFDVYIKSYIKAQAAAITVDDDGNIVLTDEKNQIITADKLLKV